MTNRERFHRVLNFEPVDRLPFLEWAMWWDKTVSRWHGEGLPVEITDEGDIREYFGLDCDRQCWITPLSASCPSPARHGAGIVKSPEDYQSIKAHLYPERAFDEELVRGWAERQKTGEMVVWISLEGFFWFPRELFGIEPHMLAFYDQAELMKQMNEDLLEFNLRVVRQFCEICVPTS